MAWETEVERLRAQTGEMVPLPGRVIPAWVADMDLPPAPVVIERFDACLTLPTSA